MCEKDEIPLKEEEKSIEFKLINELKHRLNEITNLKIELLMVRLENNDLENEVKEQKQKINAIYGKEEK